MAHPSVRGQMKCAPNEKVKYCPSPQRIAAEKSSEAVRNFQSLKRNKSKKRKKNLPLHLAYTLGDKVTSFEFVRKGRGYTVSSSISKNTINISKSHYGKILTRIRQAKSTRNTERCHRSNISIAWGKNSKTLCLRTTKTDKSLTTLANALSSFF